MNWISEMVTGKELDSAKRERAKNYEFTSQVIEARGRFEAEGWEFDKELAHRRVKLKKLKQQDEIFENRVWVMLYKLGFSHMNRTRNFTIEYKQNGERSSKQIDVLAIDDEIALFVECKCAQSQKTRNFKDVIEAIGGYRRSVFKEVEKEFPGRTMICVLATCNYTVKNNDLAALKTHGIRYFNENTIEYYEALGKTLGKAARFQLLGNLFAGREIKGMDTTVAAIRGKMGGKTYYSFSIEPSKLLKMAYILHRNSAQPDELLPTYQRLVKRSRLKEIEKFVNDGGYFPNSIIVSITDTKSNFKLAPAKNQPEHSDSRIGLLELPRKYRSIYVIDGQHRLYGYAESEYADRDSVPVVAFYDLDNAEQIKMFMDINEKQKAVPQTLRTTLNSDLLWDADDMSDRQKALRSRIAQDLGEMKESPLYDRIIIGENTKTPSRSITLSAIDKAIDKAGYLGKYKNNEMESDGIFEYGNIETSRKKILDYLIGCFSYIRETSPDEWDKTSGEGAIFTINIGVDALIGIFADILKLLRDSCNCDIKSESVEELCESGESYLLTLVNYVEDLDIEKREEFTKKYGGNGPKECLFKFRQIIHETHSEFCPEGLLDWIRDHSKQYNPGSKEKIEYIEDRLFGDFKRLLEENYGSEWLRNGVDRSVYNSIMKRATGRKYDTGEEIDPWDEVTLDECKRIATWSKNWSKIFKPYFDEVYNDGKSHSKADTSWMNEIHQIGQGLRNERNYSVSLDQYKLICHFYDRYFDLEKRDQQNDRLPH